jgi:hypothetical protein
MATLVGSKRIGVRDLDGGQERLGCLFRIFDHPIRREVKGNGVRCPFSGCVLGVRRGGGLRQFSHAGAAATG